MIKPIFVLGSAAFLLASCAPITRPPAIADFSKADSTVTVSVSPNYDNTSEILAVAQKGCDKFGMYAEGVPSGHCTAWLPDNWGGHYCVEEHYLFACMAAEPGG